MDETIPVLYACCEGWWHLDPRSFAVGGALRACGYCRHISEFLEEHPVFLRDRGRRDAIAPLGYSVLHAIRNDLRDLLEGEDRHGELRYCPIIDVDGTPLRDFSAVLVDIEIAERGGRESRIQTCQSCGLKTYVKIGGRRYVCRPEFPPGRRFFGVLPGQVAVPEALAERLQSCKLRGVRIGRIKVRSEPLDGLGVVAPRTTS